MGAIAAEELRKAYDQTSALRGVTLSVDTGEVFALIGPNGAGKTTLIRCLTGTTTPDSGEAVLFDAPPGDADAARVGLLPQEFDPPGRLTARELIGYYAGLYDDTRDVDRVLEDVGLANAADTWFENLSGGQKRRILVGIALVNDPEVLFLDEPTTGIDPAGRQAVWSLIEALAEAGTTVFATTHYMDEAERLADRVGVLVDGALEAVGSPRELIAEHGGLPRLVIDVEGTGGVNLDLPFSVERTNRGVVIHDVTPGDIDRVVDELAEAPVDFTGLTWRAPGLESVYLTLTGQTPGSETSSTTPGGDR